MGQHKRYSSICLAMLAHNDWEYFEEIKQTLGGRITAVVIAVNFDDDETAEMADKVFGKGTAHRIGWDGNFANARNSLMSLAGTKACDYILWLDPDSPLIGSIPSHLSAPYYQLMVHEGDTKYVSTHLIKHGFSTRWEGAAHELLMSNGPIGNLTSAYIERRGGGGGASRVIDHAIPTLAKELEDDPTNARACFYLAQSYRAVGMLELSAEYYQRRLGMYGFPEEEYYSLYCLGKIAWATDRKAEAEIWWLRGFVFRPTRRECIAELIKFYHAAGSVMLATTLFENYQAIPPSSDLLFVEDGPR